MPTMKTIGQQDDRQHDVHRRAGDVDEDALPARLVLEVARVVRGLVGILAAHAHVAAERDPGHPVLGLAALEPPDPLAEAEREGEDAHAERLGDEVVTTLVHEDDDAEGDDEGDGIDEEVHGRREGGG